MKCRECPYYDYHRGDKALLKDALALITEQVVEQNQNYQEQRIKQAKIDVLNELKKYSYCDNDFIDGKWHRYVFVNDIDVLLEKYANENHRY